MNGGAQKAPPRDLTAAGIGAYASGSLGTGLFSTVPAVLLLFYCTETLGIPAYLAGLAVFVPKVWSIVWDPLVGIWSDRTRTFLGRRTPFLALGGIGVFVSFVATFNTPDIDPGHAFLWILTTYFLLATTYSLFAVPYVALPAELGKTKTLRSALISSRMTVSALGNLAGAALAPMLVQYFGGGRPGYAAMSWLLATLCLIGMAGPIMVMRGREQVKPVENGDGLLRQLTVAVRNRNFRLLSTSYLLQIGATAAFVAIVPYLITSVAGRSEGEIGIALGLMLAVAALSAPLWGWIGRRYGDNYSNIWALVLYALTIAALGAAAYAQLPWPQMLAIFTLAGFPYSATQVLPFVGQAHIAHGQSELSGGAAEGAFAGTWTAIEKLGLASGPMIAGMALTLIGDKMATGIPFYIATAAPVMLLVSIIPLLRMERVRRHS